MSTSAHDRAQSALALTQEPFDPSAQLGWALLPRSPAPLWGVDTHVDILTQALEAACDQRAIPEFVCALLLDGADARARGSDGLPLWRSAIIHDAASEIDERFGWMILAKAALGPDFLLDRRLGALREACDACLAELSALLVIQNEHFALDPQARRTGELFALIDARHDCALLALFQSCFAEAPDSAPKRSNPDQ